MTNKKNSKQKKVKSPYHKQRIVAKILIVIVSLGLIVTTAFSVYAFGVIKKAPELYVEDFIQPESTKIYDSNNNEIYDTGLKIRENITYDDLPQSLIDAFVAVEDSRFFSHNGFDVPRFTKAAIENLLSSLRRGRISFGQGGSTFTMQLIKNTHFMYEDPTTGEVVMPEGGVKGIDRKIQEIYLSQKLEKSQLLSKELIFELYLNMINFGTGNNILGVQNSAEAYFNKSVSELNLVESAFLAGVINAPSINSPYYSIKNATDRTHTVLNLMKHHGYISQEELDLAKSVKLENLFAGNDSSLTDALPYQAYIDVVIDEVQELTGLNPTVVPMKIYTSMDSNIQSGIDKFQRREIPHLDQGKDTNLQVGSAVIDNATGEIIGIVGGYDYNGRLIHNRAQSKTYTPASVIKPVVDYALAFEYLGWSTSHVLVDEPWQYPGTNFLVGNYDGRYWGETTIMNAVADSRNIPALKTLQEAVETIGRSGVIEYLNKIGFSKVNSENFDLGYGIGGSSFSTSPIEIAGAYTMIMNGGNYTEPHTVRKIEFSDGREPLVPQYSSIPVISDSAAYLTSRTMKYAVDGPYPGYLSSIRKSYPVFGKTGTNRWGKEAPSYIPKNAMSDRLMMAATDQFTMATWVGFDKKDEKTKPWFTPSEASFNLPGKLNAYLLDLLSENYGAGKDLSRPSGVVEFKHIIGTFPYQSPLEDMNPDLVTTGLIRKEFLNLVEAKPQELEKLENQTVNVSQSGSQLNIEVEMSPYKDKDKLKVADNVLVMKYPESDKTATGKKLYDDSWVFGAVRYKTEIRVDGKPVKETLTDNNKQKIEYTLNGSEKDIQICSYYTYELSESRKSNEHCTKVDMSDLKSNGPSSNRLSDLLSWTESNGIDNVYVNWLSNKKLNLYQTVSKTNPNVINTNVNIASLKQSGLNIDAYDYEFYLNGKVKKKDFPLEAMKQYMVVQDSIGNGNYIIEMKVDGQSVNEIKLSEHKGKSLQLVLGD